MLRLETEGWRLEAGGWRLEAGAVRCGAVRCGAVRCGAVRCGAVRCGAVRLRVDELGQFFSSFVYTLHQLFRKTSSAGSAGFW